MATRSHLIMSPCLWRPQEDEISLSAYQDFWYLYLTATFTIGLGRHPEDLASDAAAMRKLAMVAAEAAEKLEARAVAAAEAGDGDRCPCCGNPWPDDLPYGQRCPACGGRVR